MSRERSYELTNKLLLSSVEVQEALGVGRDRAKQIMSELPVVRIGRFKRVSTTALQEWIEANSK